LNEIRKGGLVKIFEKITPLSADFYILAEEAEEILARRLPKLLAS